MAIIITGAFILTNEIPNFCRLLFSYFQEKDIAFVQARKDVSYAVFSGVKIIIALLFIGERKRIVDFIERQQAKKIKEETGSEGIRK